MKSSINSPLIPPLGDAAKGLVPFIIPFNITVGATTISPQTRQPIGSRSFLWHAIGFRSTEQFVVSLRDTGIGENFTGEDRVNTRTISGDQWKAFVLPRPYLFLPNAQIEIVAENLSGNSDTLRVSFIGQGVPSALLGSLPLDIQKSRFTPYFLRVFGATVNNGATGSTTPATPTGVRPFTLTHIGFHAPTVQSLFLLRDVASHETFMLDRVDAQSIFGEDQVPYALGVEWPISGGSALYADVENLHASTNERIDLTAIGYVDMSIRRF